ncbi:hypothetical protein Q9L42_013755 [Methylomarinum sp. Ch1-1]|uniref:Uncharacterized protein n=1 Tax=Methylomarinum roseum TaxID=3067653 RepID=A0AAU7NR20_9GAMM|nr:hypothetical protein [Methylomarinum sp. Ch1-1]MDP4520616.1 hypothetical protein [Methylomarinum sp. Ch1-1]
MIWQIDTVYFDCRNARGMFDEGLFAEKAPQPQVKIIEIKLSQGEARPRRRLADLPLPPGHRRDQRRRMDYTNPIRYDVGMNGGFIA